MDIAEVQADDVLVLVPDGSLATGEECQGLETRLTAAVGRGARRIVLDCARVDALTGPALRVLLLMSRRVARGGGRLVLCGMNAKVQQAFAISGFDRDFTVLPSRAEAIPVAGQPAVASGVRKVRSIPSTPSTRGRAARESGSSPPVAPQADTAVEAPLAAAPSPGEVPVKASDAIQALASRLMSMLGGPPDTASPPARPSDERLATLGATSARIIRALDSRPA